MEYLYILFVFFIQIIGPILLIVVLVKIFGNKTSKVPEVNDNFLSTLKDYKNKGFKTIDEIIQSIESKEAPVKQTAPVQKLIDPTNLIEEKKKSNPNSILYLGSFLVTFAMVTLMLLGWNSFSDFLKLGILFFNVFGFLVAGIYLKDKKKYSDASVTFLTVCSIGFLILGAGFWDFYLKSIIPTNLYLYSLFVSILSVFINRIFSSISKEEKRFVLLTSISIYLSTLFVTLLSADSAVMRVSIFTILNTLLYISVKSTSLQTFLDQTVVKSFTIISSVLSLFTFLTIYNGISLFSSIEKLVAVSVLFIPYILGLYEARKNNSNLLLILESILIFPKIYFTSLLVTSMSIFSNLDVQTSSLVVASTLGVFFTILSHKVVSKDNLGYKVQIVCSWLFFFITTLWILFLQPLSPFLYYIVIALTFIISYPLIIWKKYDLFSFALLNLLFIPFISYINLEFDQFALSMGIWVLLFGFVTTLLNLFWSNTFINEITKYNGRILIILTILLGILSSNSAFLLISSATFFTLYVTKYILTNENSYKNHSILLYFVGTFSLAYFINDKGYFTSTADLSFIFLLSFVLFWMFCEFVSKGYSTLEKVISILLALTTLLYSQQNNFNHLIVIFTFTLLSFVSSIKRRNEKLYYISLLLLNLLTYQTATFLGLSSDIKILLIAILNLCLSLLMLSRSETSTLLIDLKQPVSYVGVFCFLLTQSYLWQVYPDITLLSISNIIFFISMILSKIELVRLFSGIPLVLTSYLVVNELNYSLQFGHFAVMLYLLAVGIYLGNKKEDNNHPFIFTAFLFEYIVLSFESLGNINRINTIMTGLILITLTIIGYLFGHFSNYKALKTLSIVFLVLQLFVRLQLVIVQIPLWVYLLILGLGLIWLALRQIKKSE